MVSMPFVITFAAALLITLIIRKIARRFGIVDRVDGDPLKIHKISTPLMGGAAIVAAFIVGLIAYRIQNVEWQFSFVQTGCMLIGAIIIFSIGLLDDIKKLNPADRILVQIVVSIIIIMSKMWIFIIPVGWIAILFTMFFLVVTINAYNLIDGMDGLCVGLAMISCLGFLSVALISGNAMLIGVSGFLFMSLLGFLPYNFNPAKIFLGDAGSGFIGLMIGLMAVMILFKPYDFKGLVAAILIMGIPIFDVTFTVIRRFINKKTIFRGDRSHIYDFFLAKKISQKKVWILLCCSQVILTFLGVIIYRF